MNNQLNGIVIRVENLEICRQFYRDILQLGDPVMDSNFWVEFKLPGDTSLYLEKLDDQAMASVAKNRISWVYQTANTELLVKRLNEYGYDPTSKRELRVGFAFLKFYDPEGNSFYLAEI